MHNVVKRNGFTLIELLIVVVIIGLLAAIAMPKFQGTRGRAHIAAMQNDLKNLSTVQEDFFVSNGRYAESVNVLAFRPSSTIILEIIEATVTGWSARATHPSGFCVVYFGRAAPVSPATREGVISCQG